MKKIIAVLLTTVLMLSSFSMVASAKIGDVIGQALHTDIVAYINHYAIPSYAVNGQSVIVAEDLRNFGFDVTWDGYSRTLTISRNGSPWITPMDFKKSSEFGKKFTNTLQTDIKVYANGKKITSYAMNGYTMIPIEELNVFGEVYWVANERAIKLWVDGLTIRPTKQIPKVEYPITSKTYGFYYEIGGSYGPTWKKIDTVTVTSPLSYEIEEDAILYTKAPTNFSVNCTDLTVYKVPSNFTFNDLHYKSLTSYSKVLSRSVFSTHSPFTFSLSPGTYLFATSHGGSGSYNVIIVE